MLRGMGKVFKNASITAAFILAAIIALYLIITGVIKRSQPPTNKPHTVTTNQYVNCSGPVKKIGFAVTHGGGSR